MPAKEECDVLLNTGLPAVWALLEKQSDFLPIGAVLRADDTVVLTESGEESGHPTAQQVVNSLITAHRQMARSGEIKASGIAYTAVIAPQGQKKIERHSGQPRAPGRLFRLRRPAL